MKVLFELIIFIVVYARINATVYRPEANIQSIYQSGRGHNIEKRNVEKICSSKACNESAAHILENMDNQVNPCDNFYEFACGKFMRDTVIPANKSYANAYYVLHDMVRNQLRSAIEEEIKPSDPKHISVSKKLYWSCMNQTRIEERGLKPLKEILEKVGGWPVLLGDKWDEKDFDWTKITYKLRKVGLSDNNIIYLSLDVDSRNNSRYILQISQPPLDLSRDYLLKGRGDEKVEAYYNYIVDLAEILGADKSKASVELAESLEFQMKLANISLSDEEKRNSTTSHNLMTIRDLEQKYPSIPWLEYINTVMGLSWNVTQDEPILVNVPNFLSKLEDLLKETPKRVQANYIILRAMQSSIRLLNHKIRDRKLVYDNALTGLKNQNPARWKECIGSPLGMSLKSLYVRKYFKDHAKSVMEMVIAIKQQFKEILDQLVWMDEETRRAALEKLDAMETHIAYPDELLNDTKIEEFHKKSLEVRPEYYFESMQNTTIFHRENEFLRLRSPVNRSNWISHSYVNEIQAYYVPWENSIEFPAAMLQGVFFNNDRPKYMNYGAIGSNIGHKMTYAFHEFGSKYDKSGNYTNWQQPSTIEKYFNLTQCVKNQYENYTIPVVELKINEKKVTNEHIANNGGLKVAYSAYNKWANQNEPEPRLPGLENYTPQQMFWISAANAECAKYQPEYMKRNSVYQLYLPGEFRVLGPMSNMPEFSKDFNCKLGSKMNPENKCIVW